MTLLTIRFHYPFHRYKLKFSAKDETAEGQFFCFDGIAQQLVKKSCESLFHLPDRMSATPPALTAIIRNKYTFAVGLTSESYYSKQTREYQVKCVMEDFQKRLFTPRSLAIEGSSKNPTPPKPLMVIPATTTAPSTANTSSLMIDAPPAESPTPTEPATLPPAGQTTPSTTKNLHDQASSTKVISLTHIMTLYALVTFTTKTYCSNLSLSFTDAMISANSRHCAGLGGT